MNVHRLSAFAVTVSAVFLFMVAVSAGLHGVADSRAELADPNAVPIVHAAAPASFPETAQSGFSSVITFTPAFTAYLPTMGKNYRDCTRLTKLEADYILACQYKNPLSPAYGALNDEYAKPTANDPFGEPTWVVPSENGMAILGLLLASDILSDTSYVNRAQLVADYLVRIQDSDGGWYSQYTYEKPDYDATDFNKSPRQTAEVMIALYKLGYDSNRYNAMKKGAEYLMSWQNVANKGGLDDGLLGAGKDKQGHYLSWRWAHDNAYAYWALKAAAAWANKNGDTTLAEQYALSARRIITGINTYLYDPSTRVWHMAIDANGNPQWDDCHSTNSPSWIQYSPQLLDLPVTGVNSPSAGEWIHNAFQQSDGSVIGYTGKNGECKTREYPGLAFQAAMSWFDTSHIAYAKSAFEWAIASGLWQTTSDINGITGGWIDWIEITPSPGAQANQWDRFIDTSFYAIAACNGGYDFRIP